MHIRPVSGGGLRAEFPKFVLALRRELSFRSGRRSRCASADTSDGIHRSGILRQKADSLRVHDPPHSSVGPPGLPHNCWIHFAAGRCSHAGYSGAGDACNFPQARIVGCGICLGTPSDEPHQAPRRALQRRRPTLSKGVSTHNPESSFLSSKSKRLRLCQNS